MHGKHEFVTLAAASPRTCPHCACHLQTIKLALNDNQGELLLERCARCFGLFFDPGEIERVLESAVSPVFDINPKLLDAINDERYPGRRHKVKYIRCPVCQHFMRRINYGYRSGVVIDRCNAHGIWLDNGEITHLMEWRKAGGTLLAEAKASAMAAKPALKSSRPLPSADFREHSELDLLDNLVTLLGKLFK
ncbi:MAG: zf-TFIIB domain-containing protein [Methylococcales bacterium]|nr:zf-TFIIB domain-containing protein [Methylococcales bacterium]